MKAAFNVTIISREGSSSTFPSNHKVINVDLESHDSLVNAFKGQDAVVASLGAPAIHLQPKIVDAAIAAGVKRFIPSEFGSNTLDPKVNARVPIFAPKIAAVDYLKTKEDSISWSALINGPFFDWALKVGFLGFNAQTKTAKLIDGGVAKFSTTNLDTIGLAIAKILLNPELTKNQYVAVTSFITSQSEVLAIAEKLSGEKWKVEELSSEALFKSGGEKLAKHDHSGVIDLLQAVTSTKENLGDYSVLGLWNEKLGLPKEDLEQSVKAGLGL